MTRALSLVAALLVVAALGHVGAAGAAAQDPTAEPTGGPIAVGTTVETATDLNLRSAPGGPVIAVLGVGEQLVVTGDAVAAEPWDWYPVRHAETSGYVAVGPAVRPFIVPVRSPEATSSPSPSANPTPSPTPTSVASPTPTASALAPGAGPGTSGGPDSEGSAGLLILLAIGIAAAALLAVAAFLLMQSRGGDAEPAPVWACSRCHAINRLRSRCGSCGQRAADGAVPVA